MLALVQSDAEHFGGQPDALSGELTPRWRRGSPERQAAACMLKRLRAGLDQRARKVRRLRAAIKVGVYENDLKLHIAIDRLITDLL